ncbi:unnamed protein product [Urochloa humidicola]
MPPPLPPWPLRPLAPPCSLGSRRLLPSSLLLAVAGSSFSPPPAVSSLLLAAAGSSFSPPLDGCSLLLVAAASFPLLAAGWSRRCCAPRSLLPPTSRAAPKTQASIRVMTSGGAGKATNCGFTHPVKAILRLQRGFGGEAVLQMHVWEGFTFTKSRWRSPSKHPLTNTNQLDGPLSQENQREAYPP